MIRFGVIGYGYWGPNIVRNLRTLEGCQVVGICDQSPAARKRIQSANPGNTGLFRLQRTHPFQRHRCDRGHHSGLDALRTGQGRARKWQARLRREAIYQQCGAGGGTDRPGGAEKPEDHGGSHLPVHRCGRKIRQLLDEGALGKLYYYDSTRVNLGLFQHDVQRDLGSCAARSVDHGSPDPGDAGSDLATGQTHLNGHEDIAFITVYFPDKIIAHINVNWLSPVKVRTTLIGGEKKMLVWNDLEADEKIKIYDKGVDVTSREGVYNLLVNYRSGDMWAPQVEQVEALTLELGYFRRMHHAKMRRHSTTAALACEWSNAGSGQRVARQTRSTGLPVA